MKNSISFQAGHQRVTLKPVSGIVVAIVGNVSAPLWDQVGFNVDRLTRRGLTVYGSFLGTFQEFHISAKYFDFQAVKALIEATHKTDEE